MPAMSVLQQVLPSARTPPRRSPFSSTGSDVNNASSPFADSSRRPLGDEPEMARIPTFMDYGGASTSIAGPRQSTGLVSVSEYQRRPGSQFPDVESSSAFLASGRYVASGTSSPEVAERDVSRQSTTSGVASMRIKQEPEVDGGSDHVSPLAALMQRYGTDAVMAEGRRWMDSSSFQTPVRTTSPAPPLMPVGDGRRDAMEDEESGREFVDVSPRLDEGSTSVSGGRTKRYVCHICQHIATSSAEFHEHMSGHHQYKCTQCNYMTSFQGRLKRHVEDIHTPKDQRTPPSKSKVTAKRCRKCGVHFDDINEFYEHVQTHMRPGRVLKCRICPFVTEYNHNMVLHMRNHFNSRPIKCHMCSYTCAVRSMLTSHLKTHSEVHQYRCRSCNFSSKFLNALKRHLRQKQHQKGYKLNDDGSIPDEGVMVIEPMIPSARGRRKTTTTSKKNALEFVDDQPPESMDALTERSSSPPSYLGDQESLRQQDEMLTGSSSPPKRARLTPNNTSSSKEQRSVGAFSLGNNFTSQQRNSLKQPAEEQQQRQQLAESRSSSSSQPQQLVWPRNELCCFVCGQQAPDFVTLLYHLASAHSMLVPPIGAPSIFPPGFSSAVTPHKRSRLAEMQTPNYRQTNGTSSGGGGADVGHHSFPQIPLQLQHLDRSVSKGNPPSPFTHARHQQVLPPRQNESSPSMRDWGLNVGLPHKSSPQMLPVQMRRSPEVINPIFKREMDMPFTSYEQSKTLPYPSGTESASSPLDLSKKVASPVWIENQQQFSTQSPSLSYAMPHEMAEGKQRSRRKGRACKLDAAYLNAATGEDDDRLDYPLQFNVSNMDATKSRSIQNLSARADVDRNFYHAVSSAAAAGPGPGQNNADRMEPKKRQLEKCLPVLEDGRQLGGVLSDHPKKGPNSGKLLRDDVSSDSTEVSEYYECEHCGIGYADFRLYTMHMDFHDKRNPFACGLCGVSTKNAIEFYSHIALAPHAIGCP